MVVWTLEMEVKKVSNRIQQNRKEKMIAEMTTSTRTTNTFRSIFSHRMIEISSILSFLHYKYGIITQHCGFDHFLRCLMSFSKAEIRQAVAERKKNLAETHELSSRVLDNLRKMQKFQNASMIMTYVDFGKEVRTVPLINEWIKPKQIIVPYIDKGDIQLFWLRSIKELAPGILGILEPKIELRNLSDRKVKPAEIELVLVPGLGFDKNGGRVGRGKGYYDRFLARLPFETLKIALAFDFQLFPEVPMEAHDVRLDAVVTESQIYGHLD